MTRTAELMANPSVPAIFEAAFENGDIRIRVDVLERRLDGSWGLIEVKSSTGLKDHYLGDVALQVHLLEELGLQISAIELVHVNKAYVRGSDGIDWRQFFTRSDIATAVGERLSVVPANLQAVRSSLTLTDIPFAKPGKQCSAPYQCEFWDQCTRDKPADWINYLPRLTSRQAEELEQLGIESIAAIPTGFRLTSKQVIIRDAMASGEPFIAADLARLLHRFGPPARYLDFEAMMPAVPLYAGTRPYQVLPFQWSLHELSGAGALGHKEYLASGKIDPRREFAETLIEAVGDTDLPIIVYSAYEQTTLKALAVQFPDLAPQLNAVIALLADLLPIVRGAVYHPDFNFSNSIKQVAPALSPGFGYHDLDGIADGATAAAVFVKLASAEITDSDEIIRIRKAFLAYCEKDTLAMVEVHKALRRLST